MYVCRTIAVTLARTRNANQHTQERLRNILADTFIYYSNLYFKMEDGSFFNFFCENP